MSESRGILFLTRSLDRGGAERQLVILAGGLRRRGHPVSVVTLYAGGVLADHLRSRDVEVVSLEKRGRWEVLGPALRLIRIVRRRRPAIVHGYLPVPNIMLVLLKPFLPTTRVIFGSRASNVDLRRYDRLSGFTYRLERSLARWADLVIANSRAGRNLAIREGLSRERTAVVPNGIDTEAFHFDAAGRTRVRSEWEIGDDERLIGLVGRLDPMKGHPTFFEAASRLRERHSDVRFVCVGSGPADRARRLRHLSTELDLSGCLLLSGERDDMPAVYSALDVLCSASAYGEGFPNVIGESMACGVPCVVTDVGDSAWIVGDTGLVVPPEDPTALSDALERALDGVCGTPEACRSRIAENFSAARLVERTEELLWPKA